eukprot:scaffold32894_cov154-Skeletonema_menzelii.AAC.1
MSVLLIHSLSEKKSCRRLNHTHRECSKMKTLPFIPFIIIWLCTVINITLDQDGGTVGVVSTNHSKAKSIQSSFLTIPAPFKPLASFDSTQLKNITTDIGLLPSTLNLRLHDSNSNRIYVGVYIIKPNGGASTFLKKEIECPNLSPSIDTNEFVCLLPNPNDNLVFYRPQQGTLYRRVLDKTKELDSILVKHDALFVLDNQFKDDINLAKVSMSRRAGSGTYYVVSDQYPRGKIGRTVELKSTKMNRYSHATTALVTVYYDGLPFSVLSDITSNLDEVYGIVGEGFDQHGGVSEFILKATFADAVQWEKDSGGMSILFAISLHMVTQTYSDDPHFGGAIAGHNNRLLKPFHLNQIESSQQLNRAGGHGNMHEHFYSDLMAFVLESDKQVETDAQGPLMSFIEGATGTSLSKLIFIQHTHSGLLNSAQLVVGNVDSIAKFESLSDKDRSNVVDHFADALDCNLSSVAYQSVREIVNEAFRSCKKVDEDAIHAAKPLMYDVLVGTQNSYAGGAWKDPFHRKTDRSLLYDARNFYDDSDREYARQNNLESIQKLKADADVCTDESKVYYMFMWQTQSDVAVSFHFLHTVSLTFLGEKTGFETPKQVAGTILPAFILRVFVSWRLHYGDLRVGTLLSKALLLGKNGNQVLDTTLMRVKALNKFCRRHGEEASYT